MALPKRWHKSLETNCKAKYPEVVVCQGPVVSRGCIPTTMLQFPLHESLIAEPHRPC